MKTSGIIRQDLGVLVFVLAVAGGGYFLYHVSTNPKTVVRKEFVDLASRPEATLVQAESQSGADIFDRLAAERQLVAVSDPDVQETTEGAYVDLFSHTAVVLPAVVGHVILVPQACVPSSAGYSVRLRLSNPTALAFNNYVVRISWGRPSRHLKIQPSIQPLPAGDWRDLNLLLAPAGSNELTSVWLTFELTKLDLGNGPSESPKAGQ